jgi:putative ABC transport system permease protein
MIWTTALPLAVRALWRNKVRALLTALGVIIGVASVITMLAVGAGAQQRIARQLENLGSNNLVLRSASVTRGGVRTGAGSMTTLTTGDAAAIADLPGVLAVSPSVQTGTLARYRGTNWGTAIAGATPDYLKVKNWDLELGEFFTDRQVAAAVDVCVLGRTVAQELFGLVNPVGKIIVLKGLACRVIGVLAEKGASNWGNDQDDVILAPLTTVQRKFMGITHVERIEVQAASKADASRLYKEIKRLLRKRHRLSGDQGDDFRLYNRAEIAASAEESASVFAWLLGSIASVSLLVGGIGIMNIMLVSVTERTREIGIRMALGARRRDILWQFLLEALVLSGIGGAVGVVLGIGAALALAGFSEFEITIAPWSVILAFSFAAIIGIFFGLHPARKASRLQPIEALRYE